MTICWHGMPYYLCRIVIVPFSCRSIGFPVFPSVWKPLFYKRLLYSRASCDVKPHSSPLMPTARYWLGCCHRCMRIIYFQPLSSGLLFASVGFVSSKKGLIFFFIFLVIFEIFRFPHLTLYIVEYRKHSNDDTCSLKVRIWRCRRKIFQSSLTTYGEIRAELYNIWV